jgi:YidC/Oxa1 family membrane protein insertase
MDFLINIFNVTLYQPLFNVLILLYEYLPGRDFGLAVIGLTILVKLIFYPLGVQAIKSQKKLQDLQPKIKEIQEKFKKDKERQARLTMGLYQKEKINPFSGCLPLLLQLPILLALFRLFLGGVGPEKLALLYSFVPHPGQINTVFFGPLDLAEPSMILAVITGIFQFLQTKMTSPSSTKTSMDGSRQKGMPDFSQMMQKQMLYFLPAFTVLILWNLPSAVALYWLVTTLFTIGQQYIILRKI